jgi:hypothetical protein
MESKCYVIFGLWPKHYYLGVNLSVIYVLIKGMSPKYVLFRAFRTSTIVSL